MAAAAAVKVVVRAAGYKNRSSHADPLDDTLSRDKRITHSLTCHLDHVTAPDDGAHNVAILTF